MIYLKIVHDIKSLRQINFVSYLSFRHSEINFVFAENVLMDLSISKIILKAAFFFHLKLEKVFQVYNAREESKLK